ncbi:MAG TPA: bacillithiol biosynthesis cysteine-adding enzyme BshC [Saprospiraceae bacterium]|nr:bacillithiol biosynthesis cysteine-adding enzyme BshC [Saprospiraceae bacterium]HRO07843.1 bacillithiol biosynthesis cysteine-adding enzyme BshC [Saprospiraceae bacterium]HRP41241.1 bacillithiol biosynthesis cysteine-adding enzyme BshC [Saprospiraceae bacterium]
MQISKVPFHTISKLAYKDVFYQENYSKLKDFIQFEPTLKGLETAISQRKSFPVNRELLFQVLKEQYEGLDSSGTQLSNIEKIKLENTFTIVTAHQPTVMGGPGYYFYKIYSAINLCTMLNRLFPDYNFIPVFINGSEDHDFDEIKSVHMFGKSVTWETDQMGPVGRFSIEGLERVIAQVSDILGDSAKAKNISDIFKTSLSVSADYNDFVRRWVNMFFRESGLIVLNMDNLQLKKAFIPVMEKELTEQVSQSIVIDVQNELSRKFNFSPQAYVRDINLFYVEGQSRERIYTEHELYRINNTDKHYSKDEIVEILHTHPERFSPNVVMRPLYEEFTLPNLAYIGGGGEIAYWLERKKQFNAFNIFFPVLLRRNSVLFVPNYIQKMIDKLSFGEDDIWKDEQQLIHIYLKNSTEEEYDLKIEAKQITKIFTEIAEKAKAIDPTLEYSVLAEAQKTIKTIDNIEARLKRNLKQKEDVQINQIKNLKNKLFPNNNLQERVESFLPFYLNEDYDMDMILKDNLNPLDKSFLVFYM